MNIKQKVGNNIKKIRKRKGYSQEYLSFKSKLHRTYISDVERGNKNISIENLEKLAISLNVDIKDFFNFDNYNKND